MTIWVDADACPVVIRDILTKAANRKLIQVTFVANQHITLPRSPHIQLMQVAQGFDVADNTIIALLEAGDLLITSDIPLADEAITKGGLVITPRGEILSKENVKSRLNMRDFLETMRASGMQSGGPPPLNNTDKQSFANGLDQYLAKR